MLRENNYELFERLAGPTRCSSVGDHAYKHPIIPAGARG